MQITGRSKDTRHPPSIRTTVRTTDHRLRHNGKVVHLPVMMQVSLRRMLRRFYASSSSSCCPAYDAVWPWRGILLLVVGHVAISVSPGLDGAWLTRHAYRHPHKLQYRSPRAYRSVKSTLAAPQHDGTQAHAEHRQFERSAVQCSEAARHARIVPRKAGDLCSCQCQQYGNPSVSFITGALSKHVCRLDVYRSTVRELQKSPQHVLLKKTPQE